MERHRYLLVVPAAALVIVAAAACGSSGHAQPTGAMASASPSAVSPSVSGSQGRVSAQDRRWLAEAHQVNLAEVQAGELAVKKGGTPAVRSAGQMLVTDHTKLDREVTRVADSLGITLPKSVPPDLAAAADRLANESGSKFDQDFLATMVTGHQKMISDTQTQISQGSNPQIVALAKKALPDLRKHLNMLRKAQTSG
jgi:putative membrane protein